MNEQDSDVFSGSVTSEPQMVNVASSAPMYMVERSSAPQVIGILVIIYYIITPLLAIVSFLSLEFISEIDETGQVDTLPPILLLGLILLTLVPAVTIVGGGHTSSLVSNRGVVELVTHNSTGGGACLTMLSGGSMPVVESLEKSSQKYRSILSSIDL